MLLLDFSGTAASLLSTCFFIRLNRYAWLAGLIATVLNGYLYWQKGIYADTLLEIGYFSSTFYGWILWSKEGEKLDKTVRYLNPFQWGLLVGAIGFLFVLIASLLKHFTTTTVPHLDAITAALSIAAQLLMCHKIIATWVLWFVTDAIYAYLYYVKQLPFHTGLMLIYTALAVIGYCTWHRLRDKTQPHQIKCSLAACS